MPCGDGGCSQDPQVRRLNPPLRRNPVNDSMVTANDSWAYNAEFFKNGDPLSDLVCVSLRAQTLKTRNRWTSVDLCPKTLPLVAVLFQLTPRARVVGSGFVLATRLKLETPSARWYRLRAQKSMRELCHFLFHAGTQIKRRRTMPTILNPTWSSFR